MNEEELRALEERLGRPATELEKEEELQRLAVLDEQRRARVFVEAVIELGKKHGFGLDAFVHIEDDGTHVGKVSVDRRSADGYAWGDEKLLAAQLDPESPYPTKAERDAAQAKAEEALRRIP